MLTQTIKVIHGMDFTCYCINLRIIASLARLTTGTLESIYKVNMQLSVVVLFFFFFFFLFFFFILFYFILFFFFFFLCQR